VRCTCDLWRRHCRARRHACSAVSADGQLGVSDANKKIGISYDIHFDPDAIAAFQATYAAVLGNGWIVEDDLLSKADWAMMASLANGRADSRGRVRDDRMSEQFL
jgi:hypothetical protein